MKTFKIIVCLGLIFIAGNTMAQKGFQLGIKGGVTLNQIITDGGTLGKNISQSYDSKTGYVGGIWGKFGDKIFLQPEVLLVQKGGTIDVQNLGKVKFSYNNLDVPILVGFKVLSIFNIHAGPVASFNLTQDKNLSGALKDLTSQGEVMKKASYGYQLGAGVKVMGINLDIRKIGSLSDVSNLNLSNNQFKDSGWIVTVGFKII